MCYLYHYTTLRALRGMLQPYIADESIPFEDQTLLFHATDLKEMNDPNENTLFESLYSHCNDNVEEVCLDFTQIKMGNPYAVSFSSQRDSLPMWRIYGAFSDSICLAFDFDAIKQLNDSKNDTNKATLFECCKYLTDSKMDKIRQSFSKKLGQIVKSGSYNNIKAIVDQSPFYKHKSFEYEKEYRLALITTNPPKTKITHKGIRLYQEVLLPFSSLKQVIVGSFGNQKLLTYETRRLLDSYGISNNLSYHPADKPIVEIIHSKVRFRD